MDQILKQARLMKSVLDEGELALINAQSLRALTAEEVFYMATKGGGAFFGKVGSFEPGYEFDAVVLDDSRLKHPQPLDIRSRLERMIYLADEREIRAKYVKGKEIGR